VADTDTKAGSGGATAAAAAAAPDPRDDDTKWVTKLSPPDQVIYYQARLAWEQAKSTYATAEAAAAVARDKPGKDFAVLVQKYKDAKTALDGKVAAAIAAHGDLGTSLTTLSAATDPDEIKSDVSDVQAKAAALTPTIADIVKAAAAIDPAKAALVAVAEPQDKFDIATIQLDLDTAAVAKSTYALAVATAAAARDTAMHKFDDIRKALKAKVPKAPAT